MPTDRRLITHEELLSILDYDPITGIFKWKVDITRGRGRVVQIAAGTPAGSRDDHGYLWICHRRRKYSANRLAWFYVHGTWPTGIVDHRSQDQTDDAIRNLRDTTKRVNNLNRSKAGRNNRSTGALGVTRHKRYPDRIRAHITVCGVQHTLGYFPTVEQASEYRNKAAQMICMGWM